MPAFADLPLHIDVTRALHAMHFYQPSPIQLRALPIALFGNDVVGQAKSGTGKTAVFGVTAVELVLQRLENLNAQSTQQPMVLILAPTREIALQIHAVLRQIAQFRPDVLIQTFIGGISITQDQMHLAEGCHIAVGTPGRVQALLEQRVLLCSSIRLLVLDEVDKLIVGDFRKTIQYIADALPERRQTLVFSATFTPEQIVNVAQLMRSPQIVRVFSPEHVTVELLTSHEELAEWKEREKKNEMELWLHHVKQFYRVVGSSTSTSNRSSTAADVLNIKAKIVTLATLLSEIVFNQCIVFCNDKFRAEALATALVAEGWPAACITGSQTQTTRMEVMDNFRSFRSRVLVSTDLTARGIDIEKVNFVVNLDLPRDPATYLHRVGRTGRFGGKGLAVTLLAKEEVEGIELLARVFKMRICELPLPVPKEIYAYTVDEEEGKKEKNRDEVDDNASSLEIPDYERVSNESPLDSKSQNDDNPEPSGNALTTKMAADHPAEDLTKSMQYKWEEQCYERWLKLL